MKKILIPILVLSVLFCSCSQYSSTTSLRPYEVKVKNNILSYYDDQSDFKKAGFAVFSDAAESMWQSIWHKNDNIFVNEKGEIRNIVINNSNTVTYKTISVGDSIEKIENTFKYEYELSTGTAYSVLFDGTTEIDFNDKSIPIKDTYIWISYFTDGETIETIMINDVLYGREVR